MVLYQVCPNLTYMVDKALNTNCFCIVRQIHDMEADLEQQKFELQKLHTRNIQEILDDTNARLQRMDAEYNQQVASTVSTAFAALDGLNSFKAQKKLPMGIACSLHFHPLEH